MGILDMHRIYLIFFFILFVCKLFAQEDLGTSLQHNNEKSISFEAAFHFGSEFKNGAMCAIGFPLYNNESWNIRSHSGINSYTLTNNDVSTHILSITEKITFTGLMSNMGIGRLYTYINGSICFFENELASLFSFPLWYAFGFGVGTDIYIIKKYAWFFEFGLLFHFIENGYRSDQFFTTGIRYYF
jgi:hypothetical protein